MSFHDRLRDRDLHAPSREYVENQTGVTIPKLKVVTLNGMGTIYPRVILANPNLYDNFGVVVDELPNGKIQQVCVLGFMLNVDTSAWAVDTELYSTNTGTLSINVLGPVVARVIKSDAVTGVLYVTGFGTSSSSTLINPWLLNGNTGTNPNNNFLGTIDNAGVALRTNNVEHLRVDTSGRFGFGLTNPERHIHVKTHQNFSGSGLQIETLSLTTNNDVWNNVYSFTLNDPEMIKIEIDISGRYSNGIERTNFKRSGTYYRDFSTAIAGIWQSDYTFKTNNLFNIRYLITLNTVHIQVKTPTSLQCFWTGYVKLHKTINNV